MRITDKQQLMTNADMSSAIPVAYGSNPAAAPNSKTFIEITHGSLVSFHVVWTGTPTGAFKLFGSNVFDFDKDKAGLAAGDWVDITATVPAIGASNPTGAAGSFVFFVSPTAYRFYKLTYTPASGSGTVNVYVVVKG